ncbi:MAG: hypothetical protein Q9174_002486 [Haloplaca sp. 1 TL-2023]
MTLRDLLKKREKIKEDATSTPSGADSPEPPGPFTIMRSDTNTQEIISPPTFAEDRHNSHAPKDTPTEKKRFSRFRRSSNVSTGSTGSAGSGHSQGEKRLSTRLHFGSHSRSSSAGSINIPGDLPKIDDGAGEEKEAQWEKRATILATGSAVAMQGRSRAGSAAESNGAGRPTLSRSISDAKGDVRY